MQPQEHYVLYMLPCLELKWWPGVPSHCSELCIWQSWQSPGEAEEEDRCPRTSSPSPGDMKTGERRTAAPHCRSPASRALRGSPRCLRGR